MLKQIIKAFLEFCLKVIALLEMPELEVEFPKMVEVKKTKEEVAVVSVFKDFYPAIKRDKEADLLARAKSEEAKRREEVRQWKENNKAVDEYFKQQHKQQTPVERKHLRVVKAM